MKSNFSFVLDDQCTLSKKCLPNPKVSKILSSIFLLEILQFQLLGLRPKSMIHYCVHCAVRVKLYFDQGQPVVPDPLTKKDFPLSIKIFWCFCQKSVDYCGGLNLWHLVVGGSFFSVFSFCPSVLVILLTIPPVQYPFFNIIQSIHTIQ